VARASLDSQKRLSLTSLRMRAVGEKTSTVSPRLHAWCLHTCRMEPYHVGNQSLAKAWSTTLVGLDTDGLTTNYKSKGPTQNSGSCKQQVPKFTFTSSMPCTKHVLDTSRRGHPKNHNSIIHFDIVYAMHQTQFWILVDGSP
jgi:hypothetical protein